VQDEWYLFTQTNPNHPCNTSLCIVHESQRMENHPSFTHSSTVPYSDEWEAVTEISLLENASQRSSYCIHKEVQAVIQWLVTDLNTCFSSRPCECPPYTVQLKRQHCTLCKWLSVRWFMIFYLGNADRQNHVTIADSSCQLEICFYNAGDDLHSYYSSIVIPGRSEFFLPLRFKRYDIWVQ
jgi:hypothetical protein